ncbi:MAG: transglycosylase domain-containing protein, partial [Anaeroplasmataceae bacterium]|nr:transglycosylase domain-containing protein [Anaeroplasmataceae bacterium]
ILNKILLFLTILALICTITFSITGIFILNKASKMTIEIKKNARPIYIYDQNNDLISTDSLYYEYSSIQEISPHLINAVVATEDKNFYKHLGVSVPRIVSSLYQNLTNRSIVSGASTITQQYIKNTYLTNEKTLERKVNEIAYALELEKKYSKDQILEAYLNTVLFGSNIYGIKMAARYYFNKEPKDLNINESAILAGMIQLPNHYNPLLHPDEATERKNVVLKRMLENQYITQDEYDLWVLVHAKDSINKGFTNQKINYLTPYIDFLFSSLPDNPDQITSIKTYLDTNIQKDLYTILSNEMKLFNDDLLNCAIVVLDNKTYGVKAIAGNRSFNQRVMSYASDVLLQPGSTIKPLLDYAPAIEYLGYNPATILKDEEYSYHDGTKLKNYDNKYLGSITLRKALSDSRNVPAVKLFNEVGYQKAFDFVKNLGIEKNDTIYEADAIGGATNGYTLLSIANAYQAFANLGYYKKAQAYQEINYELSTWTNSERPKLAMKPTTAFLINSILHDVFKGSSYDQNNTYLMAKTGQTNFDKQSIERYNLPSNATKDSLLIAYTKDITIGVWIGYEKMGDGLYLDYYKKNIPRTIMKYLMDKYALDNQYYDIIDGIEKSYITIYNNKVYLAKDNGYEEYFQEGNQPLSYPNYEDRA